MEIFACIHALTIRAFDAALDIWPCINWWLKVRVRYGLKVSIRSRLLDLLAFDPQVWGVTEDAADNVLYMDAGHVDSLHIIGFIIDVEDEFEIVLSSDETESDEFRTLGGLTAIVSRKLAQQTSEIQE